LDAWPTFPTSRPTRPAHRWTMTTQIQPKIDGARGQLRVVDGPAALHPAVLLSSLNYSRRMSPDGRAEDLLSVNQGTMAPPDFVAVAPVGTGDWWGFASVNGVCDERVNFFDHEDGRI
jgi:hypothetical protein